MHFHHRGKLRLPPVFELVAGICHRHIAISLSNLHVYLRQQKEAPFGWLFLLAESVRFELTVGFPITSFQDWLLKPLGQLSMPVNHTILFTKSQPCVKGQLYFEECPKAQFPPVSARPTMEMAADNSLYRFYSTCMLYGSIPSPDRKIPPGTTNYTLTLLETLLSSAQAPPGYCRSRGIEVL